MVQAQNPSGSMQVWYPTPIIVWAKYDGYGGVKEIVAPCDKMLAYFKDYLNEYKCSFFDDVVGNRKTLPPELFNLSNSHSSEISVFQYFSKFIPFQYTDYTSKQVLCTATNPEHYKTAVEHLCIFIILNDYMDDTRQSWVPPSGTGSQDTETKAHKVRAKLISSGIKDINRYYKEN